MRAGRQAYGIWILFAVLVLGVVNGIVWFPVWSSGSNGVGMRILLAFITVQPFVFILERLLPTVAILGALGAYLVESGRHEPTQRPGRWWNRERFAVVSAGLAGAATIGSIVFLSGRGLDLFRFFPLAGAVVAVGSGLYLFWTAERMAGVSSRSLGLAALALACISAGLRFPAEGSLGIRAIDWWTVIRWIDIARWIAGEISLALWIVVYSGILIRGRAVRTSVPVVGQA